MKRERYRAKGHSKGTSPPAWDADAVQALRRYLGQTQQELAEELGVRQQTVSEWETGVYRPRGGSLRLLSMVAERAAFSYRSEPGPEPPLPAKGKPSSPPA